MSESDSEVAEPDSEVAEFKRLVERVLGDLLVGKTATTAAAAGGGSIASAAATDSASTYWASAMLDLVSDLFPPLGAELYLQPRISFDLHRRNHRFPSRKA